MSLDALAHEAASVKAAAFVLAVAAADPTFNDILRPYFGVPLTVLAAGAAGAIGAFAYHGEPNRLKLFGTAAVNTFLAASLVTILPLWLKWEWMTPEVKTVAEPPLAFVLAFAMRWAVPLFTEVGPTWVRNRYGKPSAPPGDSP